MQLFLTKDEKYIYILTYDYINDVSDYEKFEIETLPMNDIVYLCNNALDYERAIKTKKHLEDMVGKKLVLVQIEINMKLNEVNDLNETTRKN